MGTNKEDLRPVVTGGEYAKQRNGFFHVWLKKIGDMGDEYLIGVVEYDDGSLGEVYPSDIKFADR